jgi:hypothetical protein
VTWTVHVLHYGRALCGKAGTPVEWGPGHKWVRVDDWKDATCSECREQGRARQEAK